MTLMERARKWREERNQRWIEKGIEQGRPEGFERGRLDGIELGIPEGVERGRIEGARELLAGLVRRRIGVAAAAHFLPTLNMLSEEERVTAMAQLPADNKFADIAELEAVDSPEELEELTELLADWVDRTGAPELLNCFKEWVAVAYAVAVHFLGATPKPSSPGEAAAEIARLIERVRKGDVELDEQYFREGIEEGRRKGVEKGWLKGIGLGMAQGVEQGWVEVERELVERLVTERFGPGAADHLAPVPGSVTDAERTAAIADAVLDCETFEEFTARMARQGDAFDIRSPKSGGGDA